MKAPDIGFREFWAFLWKEKARLFRFLKWVNEMALNPIGVHRR